MAAVLPCVKCGATLSGLVEGTTATCFYCGTLNVYLESTTILASFLQEGFNIIKLPPLDGTEKPSPAIIEARIKGLQELFQNLLPEKNVAKDHILISKIDDIDFNPADILKLARSFGLLAICGTNFLLPYLHGSTRAGEIQSIVIGASIENLTLLGLYHAIFAKKSFTDTQVVALYQQAAHCYLKIGDLIAADGNVALGFDFSVEMKLYECAQQYAELLAKAVLDNPAYNSDDIEKIALKLKEIPDLPARGQILLGQVMDFYDLAKSVMFIMKDLRDANTIWLIDAYQEKIMLRTVEILDSVVRASAWVKDIYTKFKDVQVKLQRLHCGHILDYLKTYRTEFENRYDETTGKFDHILETIITNSLADYGLECVEIFDRLEAIFGRKFDPDITINRMSAIRDELEELDALLKDFIQSLLKYTFDTTIAGKTQKELISAVSDQHGQFDSKILDYINLLFTQFMDQRNDQRWILEKQRETFLTELKPRVKRLIDTSYTLREEKMPYPLFMELIILKTLLVVGATQRILLLIENPSEIPVENLRISFLVPKSFDIIKRYAKLKFLKPHEKQAIGTQVIPTESGTFHLMGMVQYEHLYEKYWLPSFKVSIEVQGETSAQTPATPTEELPPDLPMAPEDREFLKNVVSKADLGGESLEDEEDGEDDDGDEEECSDHKDDDEHKEESHVGEDEERTPPKEQGNPKDNAP